MKLRVYLDTSVFSARYDDRVPQRQLETEAFFARAEAFELSTSRLTQEEIGDTPDEGSRLRILSLLRGVRVEPVTREMHELAGRYLAAGVFAGTMRDDAVHVAAAVLTRQDILLSWNFGHLVNRRRRAKINETNVSLGLPEIEIVAPPEI